MERIFWERVPNAIKLFRELKHLLKEEKSVILQSSGSLPWEKYFLNELMLSVREDNSTKRSVYLEIEGCPGKFFLDKYYEEEIRAKYRPSETYADFLAKEDTSVFHEMYIWTSIDDSDRLSELTGFISSYASGRGRNKAKAAFFITYTGGPEKRLSQKKGVSVIRFDDYITPYDKYVFCTLASSSVKEPPFLKTYLTEMASTVVGDDIELCAECIRNYKSFLSDPYGTIKEITETCQKSDGSAFVKKPEAQCTYSVWRAQIKTIYPALEEFRERFVKRHRKGIEKNLPMESSLPGVYFTVPMDVELGRLKYLGSHKKISLTEKEYAELYSYWDARNDLSHLIPLTYEKIKGLGF